MTLTRIHFAIPDMVDLAGEVCPELQALPRVGEIVIVNYYDLKRVYLVVKEIQHHVQSNVIYICCIEDDQPHYDI